ncbi:MAG: hypothetical protein JXR10_15270 [Cyclobacteriaceae bacterium]
MTKGKYWINQYFCGGFVLSIDFWIDPKYSSPRGTGGWNASPIEYASISEASHLSMILY